MAGELPVADRTRRFRPLPSGGDTPLPDLLPTAVEDTAAKPVAFPKPGDRFLHFELVEEIGRGAFARVFLARQESLAHRLVVLKITTTPTEEPQNLARLRHTNVVPVYSVHAAGGLQAICMPYLGRVTLAHVLGGRTDGPRSGQELFAALLARRPADAGPPSPALAETLATLGRLSPVEACLWFVAQLTAGLEHAHANHLVHRDLKPANVLVTDDGVPTLLDFNVSCESARGAADGTVGGTLPYMAPEHLRAFLDDRILVSERCDLYSLGVILYELLTDRYPYPLPEAVAADDVLAAMIAQHGEPPPPPSRFNRDVPPAVDAVVAKLLDPNPDGRYATAADLREDLNRQLAHRPLGFARNTSPVERLAKWRRRNPGLAVALLAFAGLVVPAGLVVARQAELDARAGRMQRTEAEAAYHDAVAEVRTAETLLGSRTDPQSREQGLKLAAAVLNRYGVPEDANWQARPGFTLLDEPRRAELKAAFGELLILMAGAEAAKPKAARWNDLADRLFDAADRPAVIARRREEFATGLRPDVPPSGKDADLYFDGLDLAADRPAEALPLLARFCDRRPTHFLAWFARGMCHDALGQPADAQTAFAVCVALRPASPFAHTNLGLARQKLRRFAEAEADFTRALDRKPGWWPALLNRGLAREGQRKWADAAADFTAALGEPDAPARLLFLRSRVRRAAGDAAGADADRAAGLAREPADPLSWAARGSWRLAAKQPTEAVADFDKALDGNPTLRDALLNKAVALADHLHREADAIPVLDKLLALDPQHADARCSRGVYHARLGHAAAARRDAADALKLDGSAYRRFQVAGLFAQLARTDPTAKGPALDHLAQALRAGFADANLLKTDTDLDPVRGEERFRQIVAAADDLGRLAGGSRSDR